MFKWIKNFIKFKKNEEYNTEILEEDNIELDIIDKNICMMNRFLDISMSDCGSIEAILRLTNDGQVSAVFDNEHILRNNTILRNIYLNQPSLKFAHDLCSYEMSIYEFLIRLTNKVVEFTYDTDETDKYKEMNSGIMVKKIEKSSDLMIKRMNENEPFSIYVRPFACKTRTSDYVDYSTRMVSLDIANRVATRFDHKKVAVTIKDTIDVEINEIIKLLNNDIFIPIFELDRVDKCDFNVLDRFNYYIVYSKYRAESKKDFFTNYNIICEKEDIQVIAERKLKRFKGYKYIADLFNNPKYPNDYFKNNVNFECIEYMKYLFLNKMVKTKEEIITAFVDFIPTQFVPSLDEPIQFNSNKKKNNENKNTKNTKNEIDVSKFYKYEYSNADIKLSDLTKSLENNKDAKILFYGVSGSGKSLFAKKLGEKLGMEVKIVKASDILRSFVGESEQAIKNVFENLDPSNQILVFDEIDSFITERSGTKNSWEITQANEMLVQLENYKGIFIGTTNLIDNIDKAFFRRFDIKVKFDYMKKDESVNLLKDYMKAMKFKINDNNIDKIKKLNVTPAMFSVVYRRSKFEPIKNTDEYISKLEKESKHINGNSSNIGFL